MTDNQNAEFFQRLLNDINENKDPNEGISNVLYLLKMYWLKRTDKIGYGNNDYYRWLTNTFSQGKVKLPDDYVLKPSPNNSPLDFETVSHSELSVICQHEIMRWFDEQTVDKEKDKSASVFGRLVSKFTS